jgi:serine/tyrosine/threonine adenylyltransferase
LKFGLAHTYATLPPQCFIDVAPVPVAAPRLLVFNASLASFLNLEAGVEDQAASLLSGNELPEDARPIAMAYAGHQFGNFVPQLGDGRALLLGECRATDGRLYDLQLKGSGRTPFSRGGDGRAAVGPMLREYLISEAMHGLRVPTTRSLAVVATGERLLREEPLPGAVLTRVAASHLRVGTFEYFAVRQDQVALQALLAYAIARHAPELAGAQVPALAFLEWVAHRQAALIAQWLSVGFIHGVMNTDNMALSGESIDYGPCAFMDHYDPNTVFSSIDHRGRYAYGNQPAIAQWNLARFAETLLPLIDPDPATAVQGATTIISRFPAEFEARHQQLLRAKIGLATVRESDVQLGSRFLGLLHTARADFTLAFRHLSDAALGAAHEGNLRSLLGDAGGLDPWLEEWRLRLETEPASPTDRHAAMRRANPTYIPRNHLVEAALNAASERNELAPFEHLLAVVQHPFQDHPGRESWMAPPRDDERVLATFCGT